MSEWFVAVGGQSYGPYPSAQLVSMVREGKVAADAQVWRAGMEAWIPVTQAWAEIEPGGTPPVAPKAPDPAARAPGSWGVKSFADKVADLAGVERLEGFSLRELLSASFRRYSSAQIEQHFSTGSAENTPALAAIEHGWPKPWMFVRMLAGTAVIFFGFLLVLNAFPNPKLLPGLMVVGSFAVPLATLVFFFELN